MLLVEVCISFVSVISLVVAFSNTGAVLVKSRGFLRNGYFPKYIEKANYVHSQLVNSFQPLGEKKARLYRVPKKQWELWQSRESPVLNKYNDTIVVFPNVLYSNMQELEQFGDTFSFEHEPEILSADQIDILVNNADTAADDFVIQVVPTFETYSIMEKIESKLGNLYNNYDTVIVSKRDKEAENKEAENTQSVSVLHHLASDSVASDNVEAKNEAQLQQEIENDFALAEKLALEEDKSNSQPITILEDFNKINSTTTQPNNLFTNYQFFTPGIWSGLIISGFLLLILYAAIDWLSSLELTYASFEKQVDFDKKNE